MSRFFTLAMCFAFSALQSQGIKLAANNTGWLPVSSYNGATAKNLVNIFIEAQDSKGLQMNEWSLRYRVIGNITNGTKNFPADKLKFKFSTLYSNGPNDDDVTPTTSNVGINTNLLPFSPLDTFFVRGSTFNLQSKKYFSMNLLYDVLVDGGEYLSEYRSWQNYVISLEIQILNRKNELMRTAQVGFDMQVYPNDSPPNSPTYGITFDPAAKNILLEFKTPADYANGVSKEFSKAFSTYSSTAYEVQVKALDNNLTSPANRTLPLSAIRLTVKESSNQVQTGSVVPSVLPQTVITGVAHTGAKSFDAVYSTKAGDTTFFNKAYEQYSGTLIFTILPR